MRQKIFVIKCQNGCDQVRKALLERGWKESKDLTTSEFDLKWAIRARDLDIASLKPHQIVNHFSGAKCLTTKVGLLHTLRNLPWFTSVHPDHFFPRCHDLKEEGGLEGFEVDFKRSAAACVLRRVLRDGGMLPEAVPDELTVQLAMRVCTAHVAWLSHLVEDGDELSDSGVCQELEVRQLPELTEEQWLKIVECPCFRTRSRRIDSATAAAASPPVRLPPQLEEEVRCMMQTLDDPERFPSAYSEGVYNAWVLKPAGKSRGRNIRVFNNFKNLCAHIKMESLVAAGEEFTPIHVEGCASPGPAPAPDSAKAKPGPPKRIKDRRREEEEEDEGTGKKMETITWIVQRYVERPLLPLGRKMDIRQWVVVTDWAPLTVWFYRDCYIRFAAEDYELEDLDNLYMHLTNNSVAKHCETFEEGSVGDMNMWHSQQMDKYLQEQGWGHAWKERVLPAMKACVKDVMLAAQGGIDARKNSYELYGYDFLLDENLRVWLLEVNSSPTLEHSTPVTSQLCPQMVDDLMKLVVDLPLKREHKSWSDHERAIAPPGLSPYALRPSKAAARRARKGRKASNKPALTDALEEGSQAANLLDVEEGDAQLAGDAVEDAALGADPSHATSETLRQSSSTPEAKPSKGDTGRWQCIHKGEMEAYRYNMSQRHADLKVFGAACAATSTSDKATIRANQLAMEARTMDRHNSFLESVRAKRMDSTASAEAESARRTSMLNRARKQIRARERHARFATGGGGGGGLHQDPEDVSSLGAHSDGAEAAPCARINLEYHPSYPESGPMSPSRHPIAPSPECSTTWPERRETEGQVSTAGSDESPMEARPAETVSVLEESGACATIPWAGATVEALKGGVIKKTVSNGVWDSSWDSYRLNQASTYAQRVQRASTVAPWMVRVMTNRALEPHQLPEATQEGSEAVQDPSTAKFYPAMRGDNVSELRNRQERLDRLDRATREEKSRVSELLLPPAPPSIPVPANYKLACDPGARSLPTSLQSVPISDFESFQVHTSNDSIPYFAPLPSLSMKCHLHHASPYKPQRENPKEKRYCSFSRGAKHGLVNRSLIPLRSIVASPNTSTRLQNRYLNSLMKTKSLDGVLQGLGPLYSQK